MFEHLILNDKGLIVKIGTINKLIILIIKVMYN